MRQALSKLNGPGLKMLQNGGIVFFITLAVMVASSGAMNRENDGIDLHARHLSASNGTEAACAGHSLLGVKSNIGNTLVDVLLMTMVVLFTFLGLAVVCDEFFQASLEKISEVLGLSPDVAGATFLAAGSSAPELFTSISDVFGSNNNVGVGTIVGSAMFNILVIVALSAAAVDDEILIDWRPVTRDVFFFVASIIGFFLAMEGNGILQLILCLELILGFINDHYCFVRPTGVCV